MYIGIQHLSILPEALTKLIRAPTLSASKDLHLQGTAQFLRNENGCVLADGDRGGVGVLLDDSVSLSTCALLNHNLPHADSMAEWTHPRP
jgi:hypothetical protein